MLVLVINNGSTSSRFSLIDISRNKILASGGAENIGFPSSYYKYENILGYKEKQSLEVKNNIEALKLMRKYLLDSKAGIISSFSEIDTIGHRVVHGGEKYRTATIVDKHVLEDILSLSNIAPLHNKASYETINECTRLFPKVSNIAVFDTSFHLTIPEENFRYAINDELYQKYKIRKYGFHGISYNYVLNKYISLTQRPKENINTVICHLGGGSSICAVKKGLSYDTTMGYSPLSGMIMASRSGSVDPSIIPIIKEIYHMSDEEVLESLNTSSGYTAIAGERDIKHIVERSIEGDKDAIFLRKMIDNDFKKHLLSMMANLNHVESIIMTGTISSKNIEQREMLLSNLEFFGIELDKNKNKLLFNQEGIISTDSSKIPIYVIPTNEELEIARQCKKVLERSR